MICHEMTGCERRGQAEGRAVGWRLAGDVLVGVIMGWHYCEGFLCVPVFYYSSSSSLLTCRSIGDHLPIKESGSTHRQTLLLSSRTLDIGLERKA